MKKVDAQLVKTFDDLIFEPHPNSVHSMNGGIQCKIFLNEDRRISVIGGSKHFYGNGITTFEIMLPSDEVVGYQTKDEVTTHMLSEQGWNSIEEWKRELILSRL